jgi:succinoglycan biosynthesis transport protein ExoP
VIDCDGALAVQQGNHYYADLLTGILPILWRRRRVIYTAVILASGAAFLFYGTVGERYESYTLMRVGQGIKDRSAGGTPFSDGIDLVSRIDSLARIVTTDHVIRQAAEQVGFDRLFQKHSEEAGFVSKARQWAARFDIPQALSKPLDFLKARPAVNQIKETGSETNNQEEIWALRDLISTKAEGRSDLLRISFRYPDPTVAADFLNALSNALVATQADLIQVPGADIFFQQQTRRLEHEAEQASIDLQNFSIGASIYSVTDQRALFLKRADELRTSIATTRGGIEDRKGQKQAMADQLLLLRPVNQSKTVTSIVNNLRGRDAKDGENAAGTVPNFEEAPPLLLVRVYQDAMASLLKVNTEINGSLRVEKLLVAELEKVNLELASLSSKEAEYDRLKRVLTRASAAADHYGSRALEEQLNTDIAKRTQLSSVRVVQQAEKAVVPVFPRTIHLVMLALVGGIALGSAFAVMLELARARQLDYEQDNFENEVSDLSVRSVRSRNNRNNREIQAAE